MAWYWKFVGVAALTMSLSACGAPGPSEGEIKDTLRTAWEELGLTIKIKSVDKDRCFDQGNGQYECGFTLSAQGMPLSGKPDDVLEQYMKVTFEKRHGKWTMIK